MNVDLWDINLEDAGRCVESPDSLAILSDDERQRAALIVNQVKRKEYICSLRAIRTIFKQHYGLVDNTRPFMRTENGKPFIDGSSFSFSYSRTSGRAVLAVSKEGTVGIDIEVPEKLAASTIKDKEFAKLLDPVIRFLQHIGSLPDEESDRLLCAWTTLEAVIKLYGKSLAWVTSPPGKTWLEEILAENCDFLQYNHVIQQRFMLAMVTLPGRSFSGSPLSVSLCEISDASFAD